MLSHRCDTYPQGGWAPGQFTVLLPWCFPPHILGGGWALYISLWRPLPLYPQGGGAQYISSVRMSLSTKFWFSLFYVGGFHNILMEDELITYPQWEWALYNFITIISSGRISSLHILREDELGNQFLSSYWSICTQCIIGMDKIKRTIWCSPN